MTTEARQKIGGYTNLVVGGVIGAALLYLTFTLAGLWWGLGLSLLLLYEGWTLINQFPEDTISESIWRLSVRPMVPWLFGVATGWAIQSGFLHNPWLIGAWLFLNGHFFFQAFRESKERGLAVEEHVQEVEKQREKIASSEARRL